MKSLLFFLFILASFSSTAQIISGLYLGKLVNDSTKKVQTYELALNEYRGKISGYSYTTFVQNDTFYYSIKKIKAFKKDGKLIVEDDKMIINNFPESPAKKVRQINYINLTNEDTLREANGSWETTKTKIYYSLHGAMKAERDNDSSRSALIYHLKELNILGNDNYQNTDKKGRSKENKLKTKAKEKQFIVKSQPTTLPYNQRKNILLQTINTTSDSLNLSFYDNGVIDGDSISVYQNEKNIISHYRLTATAGKKTIHLGNNDSTQLLLVAENLGTIPPNTGLLIIKDGENDYQVNFSADMQTNASIIIRRKKK